MFLILNWATDSTKSSAGPPYLGLPLLRHLRRWRSPFSPPSATAWGWGHGRRRAGPAPRTYMVPTGLRVTHPGSGASLLSSTLAALWTYLCTPYRLRSVRPTLLALFHTLIFFTITPLWPLYSSACLLSHLLTWSPFFFSVCSFHFFFLLFSLGLGGAWWAGTPDVEIHSIARGRVVGEESGMPDTGDDRAEWDAATPLDLPDEGDCASYTPATRYRHTSPPPAPPSPHSRTLHSRVAWDDVPGPCCQRRGQTKAEATRLCGVWFHGARSSECVLTDSLLSPFFAPGCGGGGVGREMSEPQKMSLVCPVTFGFFWVILAKHSPILQIFWASLALVAVYFLLQLKAKNITY